MPRCTRGASGSGLPLSAFPRPAPGRQPAFRSSFQPTPPPLVVVAPVVVPPAGLLLAAAVAAAAAASDVRVARCAATAAGAGAAAGAWLSKWIVPPLTKAELLEFREEGEA